MRAVPVQTKRWTRVQYERAIDRGIFHEDEHLELLDGVLVVKEPQGERLMSLLHTSPRSYSRKTSVWTLSLLAEVAAETHITPRQVSGEAIRQALVRLDISWKRAKTWITSPDPEYAAKKADATV